MNFSIAVLPGDGIGPEVVEQGVKALGAVGGLYGHAFKLSYGDIGGVSIDKHGVALRDETLEMCRRSHAILFGAVGGPKWDDPKAKVRPEQGLLALRKGLNLFANLRPVKVFPQLIDASPVKAEVLKGVDMMVVRELTGGLYFAKPKRRWQTPTGRRGVDTLRYTEAEICRILHVGFQLARTRRKKLISVDKANVLETSRLWRELAVEVSREYPDVALDHMLVDTAAMQLVRAPSKFDVIVTENTFGDILTDEAAVLAGSMGMLPSASLAPSAKSAGGPALGLYEPIHGSAPDIAGKGIANPVATLLSVAMMLRLSLGLNREAESIERAVELALADGYRTADIAKPGSKPLSTAEMGRRVTGLVAAA
ncbi:MAG: 3-isopropylmalate dehydrogenase [SAR202 cluster bacterium]|nr:3-isopropylmalate dehydrogenase [SAR202 cluster bacterium]